MQTGVWNGCCMKWRCQACCCSPQACQASDITGIVTMVGMLSCSPAVLQCCILRDENCRGGITNTAGLKLHACCRLQSLLPGARGGYQTLQHLPRHIAACSCRLATHTVGFCSRGWPRQLMLCFLADKKYFIFNPLSNVHCSALDTVKQGLDNTGHWLNAFKFYPR